MADGTAPYDMEIAALQVAKLTDQVRQYLDTVDGLQTAASFGKRDIGLNERHQATTHMEELAATWEDAYDAVRTIVHEEYDGGLEEVDTVDDPIGSVYDDDALDVETDPRSICEAYVAAEKALLEAETIAEDVLGTAVRERAETEPAVDYTPEVRDNEYGL